VKCILKVEIIGYFASTVVNDQRFNLQRGGLIPVDIYALW